MLRPVSSRVIDGEGTAQLTHHVITTSKKCGGYVKVALTWHSHVAMRWQLGESGIDVAEPSS